MFQINKGLNIYTTANGPISFDEVERRSQAMASLLNKTYIDHKKGTLNAIAQYSQLIVAFGKANLGTVFDLSTAQCIKNILLESAKNGRKIRCYLGNTVSGTDSMSHEHLSGYFQPVAEGILEIPAITAQKGNPWSVKLKDHEIIRIQEFESGTDLYRHENYNTPSLSLQHLSVRTDVLVEGRCIALFSSENRRKAQHFVDFIKGERQSFIA